MKRIVINADYGGFCLSHAAILRYAEIKGLALWPERDATYSDSITYWLAPPHVGTGCARVAFYDGDILRDDPALVQVVEELGPAANGLPAALTIVHVPEGDDWAIDELDGKENIVSKSELRPRHQ